jgi:hypothetical protein
MYSPEELLAALEQATPESKSKAIFTLQEYLLKACKEIEQFKKLCQPLYEGYNHPCFIHSIVDHMERYNRDK